MAISGYPTPVRERHGCKVSWYTYDTEEEAKAAAKVARRDAKKQAAKGFDFGYCVPGRIEPTADGKFEVTLP